MPSFNPDAWLNTRVGLAFLAAMILLGLGMKLAPRLGLMARVSEDRWHKSGLVPKFAGPALLVGVLFALPPALWLAPSTACLIGCIDDARRFPAGRKALLMLIPALIAAFSGHALWLMPAVWIAMNAWNLLDHADGIAGGAAFGAVAASGLSGSPEFAAVLLAFLIVNWPPAKSFMGDGGSLTLGSAIPLLAHQNLGDSLQGPMIAFALCALPLADSLMVVIARIRRGAKPWIGGTDHSGHRLLRAGMPAFALPLLYALFGAALTLLLPPWLRQISLLLNA